MLGVGEAASAEEITPIICLEERTCVWEIWNKIRIVREREREAQRVYLLLSKCNSYNNEQQPLQKVTKSLYIVTHLGQLPFVLFT